MNLRYLIHIFALGMLMDFDKLLLLCLTAIILATLGLLKARHYARVQRLQAISQASVVVAQICCTVAMVAVIMRLHR